MNKIGGYDCICPRGHLGNGTVTNPCIVVHGAGKLIHGKSRILINQSRLLSFTVTKSSFFF